MGEGVNLMGKGFSFVGGDEKVWELDRDAGCMTLSMD